MQRLCHKCGKDVRNNSGVVRSIKTGVYSDGASYFRSVNLCQGCSRDQTGLERSRIRNKILFTLSVIVTLVAVSYLLLFR